MNTRPAFKGDVCLQAWQRRGGSEDSMSYLLTSRAPGQDCSCGQCPDCLQQGIALFRRFHCFPEARIVRRPCRRLIPRVLVKLGHLRGLIYSSDRGQPQCDRTYIHFMETPALLACDATGRQLYIIGGNYQVTQRGIEG